MRPTASTGLGMVVGSLGRETGVVRGVVAGMGLCAGELDAALAGMKGRGREPGRSLYLVLSELWHREGNLARSAECKALAERAATPGDLTNINHLLGHFAELRDAKRFRAVEARVKEYGLRLNSTSYSVRFGFWAGLGRLDEAEAVVKEMRASPGLASPQGRSLPATLLELWARAGVVAKAEELLEELKVYGLVDLGSYGEMLALYFRVGSSEKFEGLLREMLAPGPGAAAPVGAAGAAGAPEARRYNKVLELFCQQGLGERAALVVALMREQQIQPNAETYELLLEAWYEKPEEDPLGQVMNGLRGAGLQLSAESYVLLIDMWVRLGDAAMAEEALEMSVAAGHEADTRAVASLAELWCRVGKFEQAEALVGRLNAISRAPTSVLLNTTLELWARVDREDKLGEVLAAMQSAGVALSPESYLALIEMHARFGRAERVDALREEMASNGVPPSRRYFNVSVKAWASLDRMDRVKEVMDTMRASGVDPTVSTYTIIMDVLGKAGYISRAEAIFEEMKAAGLSPDNKAYNTLLAIWGRHQRFDRMERGLKEMREAGLIPCTFTFQTFINSIVSHSDNPTEALRKVLKEMKALGLRPDPAMIRITQRSLVEKRNPSLQELRDFSALKKEWEAASRGG